MKRLTCVANYSISEAREIRKKDLQSLLWEKWECHACEYFRWRHFSFSTSYFYAVLKGWTTCPFEILKSVTIDIPNAHSTVRDYADNFFFLNFFWWKKLDAIFVYLADDISFLFWPKDWFSLKICGRSFSFWNLLFAIATNGLWFMFVGNYI